MRSLSPEEQNLCQKILNDNRNNNSLANIIDDKLKKACIELNNENSQVRFLVEGKEPQLMSEADAIFERMREVSIVIVTATNLLQMLEKDGYIMMYQSANSFSSVVTFGQCARNLPKIPYTFADSTISQLLIDYNKKEIITTQAFTEFCERGYIARDEQRFQRQVKLATIALCVSAASCLFSAFSLYKNATSTASDTMLERSTDAVKQLNILNGTLANIEKNTSIFTNKIDTNLIGQKKLRKISTSNTINNGGAEIK